MAICVARLQPLRAEHGDVHPRDDEDARAAPRRRADRALAAALFARRDDRVAGQIIGQMRRDRDGPDARPAAAVRNAERLVQIQMADIHAEIARTAKADLRGQIRAVHVDLPAVRVDDLRRLDDGLLEHAVGGGIGDHRAGEIVRVLRRPSRADRRCRCCHWRRRPRARPSCRP